MSERKVPKIRFPGFTGDWEERSFSDLTFPSGRRNTENLDLVPYAITNENGFIPQKDAHDDFGYMKNVDRRAYNIVHPKSFAYNPARINVGSLGYYTGTEDVIVSSLYEVFSTVDKINDRFLWHWFKSNAFLKWINKLQEGSVRLYFYYDKLCECKIHVPSLEEQQKIAKCLDDIDQRIFESERELDKMKELKKGMLQKMLPKEGESVPEIRFPGFTDSWKLRKLSATKTFFTDGNYGEAYPKASDMTDSSEGIPFLTGSNLKDGRLDITGVNYITKDKHVKLTSGHLEEDDIVIAVRGSLGTLGYVNKENVGWNINSQLAILRTDKSELCGKFLLQFLLSGVGQNELLKRQTGSALKQLPIGAIKEVDVPITSILEQQRIGEFFSNLDSFIILQKRECDKWQTLKKALLQQMFV